MIVKVLKKEYVSLLLEGNQSQKGKQPGQIYNLFFISHLSMGA